MKAIAHLLADDASDERGDLRDALAAVVADRLAIHLEDFDLELVRERYRAAYVDAVAMVFEMAGYPARGAAARARGLLGLVAFQIEDRFDRGPLALAERLYHAAVAGADFEATAVSLIASGLRRLPPQERGPIARALGGDLIIGQLAAGDGDSADVGALWRRGRAIAQAALQMAEVGDCEQGCEV